MQFTTYDKTESDGYQVGETKDLPFDTSHQSLEYMRDNSDGKIIVAGEGVPIENIKAIAWNGNILMSDLPSDN